MTREAPGKIRYLLELSRHGEELSVEELEAIMDHFGQETPPFTLEELERHWPKVCQIRCEALGDTRMRMLATADVQAKSSFDVRLKVKRYWDVHCVPAGTAVLAIQEKPVAIVPQGPHIVRVIQALAEAYAVKESEVVTCLPTESADLLMVDSE